MFTSIIFITSDADFNFVVIILKIKIIYVLKNFICLVSRDIFNKWQAQRWWAENFDKVMELYNVQRFNRQAVPLPTPPRSEDEVSFFPILQ